MQKITKDPVLFAIYEIDHDELKEETIYFITLDKVIEKC